MLSGGMKVLRGGPAPLTLASLGAAGTSFSAAHSARRQASARGIPGRDIRGVDHRRAPGCDALRRAHMRRGCLARAAETSKFQARHAGAHQLRGPAAPPLAARFSGSVWGLSLGRLTIGCSGCGAGHVFSRTKVTGRPRPTDPWGVRPLGRHCGSRR